MSSMVRCLGGGVLEISMFGRVRSEGVTVVLYHVRSHDQDPDNQQMLPWPSTHQTSSQLGQSSPSMGISTAAELGDKVARMETPLDPPRSPMSS